MSIAPPLIKVPLYQHIAALKAEACAKDRQPIPSKQRTNQPQYIYTQLKDWVNNQTSEQLCRSYEIQEIISLAKLTGKHRDNPSYQQVAKALRLLGFRRKRSWRNTSRNHRHWVFKGE